MKEERRFVDSARGPRPTQRAQVQNKHIIPTDSILYQHEQTSTQEDLLHSNRFSEEVYSPFPPLKCLLAWVWAEVSKVNKGLKRALAQNKQRSVRDYERTSK